MSNNRRFLTLLVLILGLVAFTAACQSEPDAPPVIGFSYGLDDSPLYDAVRAPLLAEAERLGFEVVEGAAASNCEKQLADIDNMIASGVDAVAFLFLCPGGYDDQIARAHEADIKVVCYLWDHPDCDGVILENSEQPGAIISEAAIDWYENEYTGSPEEFSWAIYGCSFAPPNIQMRTDIPKAAIMDVVGVEPLEAECVLAPQPALDATTELLQADPNLNMVISLVDSGTFGAYQALEQFPGVDTSNVFLAGVDGEPAAVELIRDGGGTGAMYKMSAAIDFEALGFAVVRVSKAAMEGDESGTVFNASYVKLGIEDPDFAGEWYDRVFSKYFAE